MSSTSHHVYFPKLDLSLLSKRPSRDAETKFPCKLHKMLQDVEKKELTHIISWHNDGKCFRVHEPEEFVQRILPLYSKKAKYRSFQRQLNLYGFHRITALKPFWESCYHHPDFSKDDEDGCRKINRPLRRKSSQNQKIKDQSKGDDDWSRRSSPTQATDFDDFMMSSHQQHYEATNAAPTAATFPLEGSPLEEPLFQTESFSVEDEERVDQAIFDVTYNDQSLTRSNSYQDMCESIMGKDCEACKDGARLMNEIIMNGNIGFAV